MLVIGLILILVALVVIGYMLFGTANLDSLEIDLGVMTVSLNPLQIFLLGAISVLILAVGTVLLFSGMRRQRRKRKELHDLRAQASVADRRQAERAEPGPAPRDRDRVVREDDDRRALQDDDRRTRDDDRRASTEDDRSGHDQPARGTGDSGRIDLPMDHRTPPRDDTR